MPLIMHLLKLAYVLTQICMGALCISLGISWCLDGRYGMSVAFLVLGAVLITDYVLIVFVRKK